MWGLDALVAPEDSTSQNWACQACCDGKASLTSENEDL